MSQQVSLATLNGGGIVEAVDVAIAKIAANIEDVNTPPDKPRKLVLEIVFKPDKARSFTTATATVKTTLQPEEAQEIALLLDSTGDKAMLFEAYKDTNPKQHPLPGTMPGELKKPKNQNVTPFKNKAEGE